MDIFQAVKEGDFETVDIYLKSGGRTDISDFMDDPLIFKAIESSNLDILLLLLSYNADVNVIISTDDGEEEVFLAVHAAVTLGNEQIVNALLIHGADPNSENMVGQTPLHKAAERNKVKVLELLLLYGADPDIKDSTGDTAMDVALSCSHTECVNVLLGNKETVESKNTDNSVDDAEVVVSGKRKKRNVIRIKKTACEGDNFEVKKQKLDREIHSLKDERRELLLSSEKSKGAKAYKDMNITKQSIIKNYEKLKKLQQTISESCTNVTDVTKQIMLHDSKILRLMKAKPTVSDNSDDENSEYECPVCLQIPLPPLMVYQCLEGHIFCSKCKENPNMTKCPQCRQPIKSLSNRSRVMEKLIEKKFGY